MRLLELARNGYKANYIDIEMEGRSNFESSKSFVIGKGEQLYLINGHAVGKAKEID